ncbi:MerR family transcriptional regulator [Shewanella zhangzhouensis]|uniref:MerR family transcriptional regulator n=1 Tax=Shewanella zhangzhouensis TaxID=2864213 RepID=UPI001C65FD4A|nr:MerR family transcriptional regulator [Shewanella zhangzhouensis]QYK05352.1 MerR family transcriptional regulator [Shewanella zhangzhouensis]
MALRISELANRLGLSRSTLLYYEKQGLIRGKRLDNGYRVYSEKDVQRLTLIQKLQAGGLTLKESLACLDERIDKALLQARLAELDADIAQKQASRALLAALLGEGDLKAWHESLTKEAPEAHLDWLQTQGFSEKDALHLTWLSKDMNEHDKFMADFMHIFAPLTRWAPGSEADTLKALATVPLTPTRILDIGCGKGLATRVLAMHTRANIIAIDNEEGALTELQQHLQHSDLASRVSTLYASMTDIPLPAASADLIWAEGSAYIMGVEQALKSWRNLLVDNGVLVLSDLVWLTDDRAPEAITHWQQDYPAMTTVEARKTQMRAAGFDLIESFSLSNEAWQSFTGPLAARVDEVSRQLAGSQALANVQRELGIFSRFLGQFGYQFFVLQKRG